MRPLFVLLLLAVPAFAAPVPKAVKKANASPDGHWYLTEVVVDGTSDTKLDGFHRHTLIEGDRYSCAEKGRPAVHPSANFTIFDADRPLLRKWGVNPAVVEVDGDTLRACYAYEGRAELTECKPGKGIHYYIFERAKE